MPWIWDEPDEKQVGLLALAGFSPEAAAYLSGQIRTQGGGLLDALASPITDMPRNFVNTANTYLQDYNKALVGAYPKPAPGAQLVQFDDGKFYNVGADGKASPSDTVMIGNVLPIGRNEQTGEYSPETPSLLTLLQTGMASEIGTRVAPPPKGALGAGGTKRAVPLQSQLDDLAKQAEVLRPKYQQEVDAHMAGRPAGVPRSHWLGQMSKTDDMIQYEWIVSRQQELRAKMMSAAKAAEKKAAIAPLRDAMDRHGDVINSVHKSNALDFNAMPVDVFNDAPAINIHKSPSYGGRQSSEYKLIMVDGRPAYARKSNHWGQFSTNIKNVDEAVAKTGMTRAEAMALQVDDPFGRVAWDWKNWQLRGGDSGAKTSQAGYIFLDDLIGAKRAR